MTVPETKDATQPDPSSRRRRGGPSRNPAGLSPDQRAFMELHHRYGFLPRKAGAKLLGVSPEAFRCRMRRLKARGLLEKGDAPGETVYTFLSARGAASLGVAPPRQLGPLGLWARLAIAEACAENGLKLLTHEEFLSLLGGLEPHMKGQLALPGLPRARWRVEGDSLSFFHVDLLPQVTGHALVGKLASRAKKLARRSDAWASFIQGGHLSFSLVTPGPRAAEVNAAARAGGFSLPIHFFEAPILRHALQADVTSEVPVQ